MNDSLEALNKGYLGRGIIIGKNEDNVSFVTYILTGRSDSSKARTLEFDERCGVTKTIPYTAPTDMRILEKGSPVLLLYPAIMILPNHKIAISNGAQTKLIYNQMRYLTILAVYPKRILMNSLEQSFFEYDPQLGLIDITSFEPDPPNFTSRISGCVVGDFTALAISRRNKYEKVEKKYFEIGELEKSKSKLIMTYNGVDTGKEPLHSFTGEPLDLRLTGKTEEEITQKVREAINPSTFIAVATQFAVKKRRPYIINLHGGE